MKKTLFKLSFLLLVATMFIACTVPDPSCEVRFQNSTTDVIIYYGVRLGEAAYSSSLSIGNVSSYAETTPGTYSVQMKDVSGTGLQYLPAR